MTAWRKFLKDLITYFREVSSSYEHRAKSLLKVSNVINNTNAPAALMTEGGLNDANRILRDFHKQAIVEANKARDIESDVINQLSGLRADLAQKIKEIKSLSGDFKNNVEKEKETTRKCVTALEEALAVVDSDPSAIVGKGDPYVVRLGVERQVERQIDEENYLHRVCLSMVRLSNLLMFPGLPQPRELWSRARVDCGRRSSESVQCSRQHFEARRRRDVLDRGKTPQRPNRHAERS